MNVSKSLLTFQYRGSDSRALYAGFQINLTIMWCHSTQSLNSDLLSDFTFQIIYKVFADMWQHLSWIHHGRPMEPLDEAVFWIKFVLCKGMCWSRLTILPATNTTVVHSTFFFFLMYTCFTASTSPDFSAFKNHTCTTFTSLLHLLMCPNRDHFRNKTTKKEKQNPGKQQSCVFVKNSNVSDCQNESRLHCCAC